MAAYQICVRCENRWPVSYQPRQWCPGCRGLLLSPVDSAGPVPPSRRNFRWVARPPHTDSEPTQSQRPEASRTTPAYDEVPRWGLHDNHPVADEDEPSASESLADLAPTLLAGAAVVFGLAALAELFRYGLLVFNRTRLVDPLVLAVSDAAVWATQVCGPVVALASALACALRLLEVRRKVFAARGTSDPRHPALVLLGVVVPGANLGFPGLFLTEIAGHDPRLLRAVRTWWVLWVLNAVVFVAVLLSRQRDTLQARADAVLLTAIAAAFAAVVAVVTLHVVRLLDRTDLWGRPLRYRRLTPTKGQPNGPITPIVPIVPADLDAAPADLDAAPAGLDTADGDGATREDAEAAGRARSDRAEAVTP
ncbi:DUF4328 domain-containing protein [Rhodococcus chondri]|uniref:DUF4328 domain-containing protein n=1 Tax=Rhodococcus chondri TaxID=3065941 RepID=A0ABU7JLZ5_9NOCA|nr:DUF4328 domain-containing protein [Rhodococcus sp. CC-R104]MEE2030727.1 DUF4328 domain-containing protein [Rhodococcus sp. CC-R104]